MKNFFLLLCVVLLLLSSCSKAIKEEQLIGVWQQNPYENAFAGTIHRIKLNADKTFEMKLDRFSDIIDIEPVPCSDNRTDYAKGTYQLNDGRISFAGAYYDASYSRIEPNCKGADDYEQQYQVSFKEGEMIFTIPDNETKRMHFEKQ